VDGVSGTGRFYLIKGLTPAREAFNRVAGDILGFQGRKVASPSRGYTYPGGQDRRPIARS